MFKKKLFRHDVNIKEADGDFVKKDQDIYDSEKTLM